MERRRLVAVGGVLSVTAFATTVGLGATFGLFGLTQPESPVGRLGGPAPAAAQVDAADGSGAAATSLPGTGQEARTTSSIGGSSIEGSSIEGGPIDDGADD